MGSAIIAKDLFSLALLSDPNGKSAVNFAKMAQILEHNLIMRKFLKDHKSAFAVFCSDVHRIVNLNPESTDLTVGQQWHRDIILNEKRPIERGQHAYAELRAYRSADGLDLLQLEILAANVRGINGVISKPLDTLIKAGIDLIHRGPLGLTCLHLLAMQLGDTMDHYRDLLELLLEHGADPTILDGDGNAVFDYQQSNVIAYHLSKNEPPSPKIVDLSTRRGNPKK
jgi:hypothetical protein